MEKITFCIPSKNNLRYLKWCLESIRKNSYRKDHDIIVFVDKDTDGTVKWLNENHSTYNVKYIVNPDINNTLYGIGRSYDKCIAEATTDIIMVFHADMYLCKNADLIMYNKLTEKSVVCATRIEPPLHPPGPEKIVENFGMWPETDIQDGFKEVELNEYVNKITVENSGKITNGCFAPWMVHKNNIVSIGGHDPIMKSAREDSDIFNRFVLSDFELVQVRDAYVYHLTCRGGQFEHGILTNDHSQKSKDWQELMEKSTWDYVRKWGSFVKHDEYLNPLINAKYDIGFLLTNADYESAKFIEPWVSVLYLEDVELVNRLRNALLEKTSYNISERIKHVSEKIINDVIIEIDRYSINANNSRWVLSLNEIITEAGEPGVFEMESFKINIAKFRNIVDTLIPIKNEFFITN